MSGGIRMGPLVLLWALGGCGSSDVERGEGRYAQLCASCHGSQGEGRVGPSLRNWDRGEAALVTIIERTMPFDAPGSCTGDCAREIARYILATFVGDLVCGDTPPTPRGLRLLTRREYLNSVNDLLPHAGCSPPTFHYDPKGQTLHTVHVAGSFNNWAPTIAQGGWALTWSDATRTFATTHALPPGHYTYKLVLDESQWVIDPDNTQTAPDGFGGQNSVLDVACDASGGDPTAGFPPEVRPDGFAFDDHGPARAVGAVHVEQYQAAAATLAARATADLDAFVGCDYRADAAGCAASLVTRFGLRAFRRPLSATEVARYQALVLGPKDFAAGVTLAVRAMLGSPGFLYRSELGEPQPDGTFRLSPYEIASALSYQLWATTPDDALLAAAAAGELATPAGIEKQARRLLADPRARAVLATFAEQWLGIESVTSVDKRSDLFPDFSPALRQRLRDETRQFVVSVVFDGSHGYDELLEAKYSFLDPTLAGLYGVPPPSGDDLVKTALPQGRSGLLGQASVLAVTAHSDQTSPIRRGLFVRRALLCQEFPAPPPNAGGLPAVDPKATTRERFRQHSADPSCASCHRHIDPVGFGFERFDPIGRVRDGENGQSIDATGDLDDVEGLGTGTTAPFSSLPELAHLLSASDSAKTCFVRQYFRFARGYHEASADACTIDALARRFRAVGYDIRELMVAMTLAPEFVVRHQEAP